jgi:hypothetical protein
MVRFNMWPPSDLSPRPQYWSTIVISAFYSRKQGKQGKQVEQGD